MSESVTPPTGLRNKKNLVVDKIHQLRDKLANYQESKGVSKDEKYSFLTLVAALFLYAFNAAALIANMLINLLPIFDGFMYFNRFMLDNIITIIEIEDRNEQILKAGIFVIELFVSLFVLFLIISIILVPIFMLINCLVGRVVYIVRTAE